MKIATWNVNSMKVRLPHVLEWMSASDPDVLVLQEIKQVTEMFPADELAAAGYRSMANGQKTYNGVAVISKQEPGDPDFEIPGLDDPVTGFDCSQADDLVDHAPVAQEVLTERPARAQAVTQGEGQGGGSPPAGGAPEGSKIRAVLREVLAQIRRSPADTIPCFEDGN